MHHRYTHRDGGGGGGAGGGGGSGTTILGHARRLALLTPGLPKLWSQNAPPSLCVRKNPAPIRVWSHIYFLLKKYGNL